MKSNNWTLAASATVLAAMLTMATAPANALSLPDWAAIFNSDGSAKDEVDASGALGANGVADHKELAGGIHAIFMDDIQSDGEAVDLSTYNGAANLADGAIDNGLVALGDDLGNALVFSSESDAGALELFVGVERTIGGSNGSVEIELNQDAISPGMGRPWAIKGARQDGDLKVTVSFTGAGTIDAVSASVWDGVSASFVEVQSASASAGCAEAAGQILVCDGAPIMTTQNDWGRWDLDSAPLPAVDPDAFLEVGVNVEGLVGDRPAYRVVQVRSAGDIIMSSLWSE